VLAVIARGDDKEIVSQAGPVTSLVEVTEVNRVWDEKS
jgi:hypothetical protein